MTVGSDAGAAPPVVTVDVIASGGSFIFGSFTLGRGPWYSKSPPPPPPPPLLDCVRKHGSYKRYMRAPHRDVLACRGLAQRGKLSTEHRALNFLAKQGDNGTVWTVLSYWRATE